MKRIGASFPLEPFRPGIRRVEIVFDREAELAREILCAFADQQVMVCLQHDLAGHARWSSDAFERTNASGLLAGSVHDARVELYDSVGVRESSVTDAVVERIELHDIDPRDQRVEDVCPA